MGVAEILVMAALAIWAVLAVLWLKKRGASCGGNCSGCGQKNCKKRVKDKK